METLDVQKLLKLASRQDRLFVRAHIDNKIPFQSEVRIEVWFSLSDVPPDLFGVVYRARLAQHVTDGLISLYPSTTPGRVTPSWEVAKAVLGKWRQTYPAWLQPKQEVVTYEDDRVRATEEKLTGWLLFAHLLQLRAAVDIRESVASLIHDDRRTYYQLSRRLNGLIAEVFRLRFEATRGVA